MHKYKYADLMEIFAQLKALDPKNPQIRIGKASGATEKVKWRVNDDGEIIRFYSAADRLYTEAFSLGYDDKSGDVYDIWADVLLSLGRFEDVKLLRAQVAKIRARVEAARPRTVEDDANEGHKAEQRELYSEAIDHFRQAYGWAQNPTYLVDIAQCFLMWEDADEQKRTDALIQAEKALPRANDKDRRLISELIRASRHLRRLSQLVKQNQLDAASLEGCKAVDV